MTRALLLAGVWTVLVGQLLLTPGRRRTYEWEQAAALAWQAAGLALLGEVTLLGVQAVAQALAAHVLASIGARERERGTLLSEPLECAATGRRMRAMLTWAGALGALARGDLHGLWAWAWGAVLYPVWRRLR